MKLDFYQKQRWQTLHQKICLRKMEILDTILFRYRYYYGLYGDWDMHGDWAMDPVINKYYNELQDMVFPLDK